jgi:hypothetical protein
MPVIIGNNRDETLLWADTAGRVTDEATYGAAIDKVFGAEARKPHFDAVPCEWISKPSRGIRSTSDLPT